MRLAFVVQRYGDDVAGGAEALCRLTATALVARGHEVTVLTSTARDYLHWSKHYREGITDDAGIRLQRFNARPADPDRAGALKRHLDLDPGHARREREWALCQGPVCPALLTALAEDGAWDVVVFWTYLYATTQLGLPLARGRSLLVPLAHDEPMLRYGLTRGVMSMADGLAFLTREERRLVDDLHGIGDRPESIVGTGLQPPVEGKPQRARAEFDLPPRFVLYLGRLDAAKGVDRLIAQHAEYRRGGGTLGLALAGRGSGGLEIPPNVATCGFVSDRQRADLLEAAELVVLPSAYESLSLVALEAWQRGTPTLANARSEVLAGQTARSGGGLLYDERTYARQLTRLAGSRVERQRRGDSAKAWVQPYTWDACIDRWEPLLSAVAARTPTG